MDTITAAGHVYHPTRGSGVEWQPGLARLWQDGVVIAEATQAAPTAYEFFHELKFAEAFPMIQYWWFRSQWAGLVAVSRPEGMIAGEETLYGYMQFGEEEGIAQMWTVSTSDAPVSVAVPFPPGNTEPLNLPLRWQLARLVMDTLIGHQDADDLLPVSSLVRRDDSIAPLSYDGYIDYLYAPTLEQALPTRLSALTAELPYFLANVFDPEKKKHTRKARWVLEDVRDEPLRDLLCEMQGLKGPIREPVDFEAEFKIEMDKLHADGLYL